MTYQEYLKAARKHQSSCTIIRSALIELNDSPVKDPVKIKQLTLNLYYLSGYVIECAVKFAIYVYINYDKTQSVRKLDTPEISYQKHIGHHRFDRYVDKLNQKYGGIILIDKQQDISREVKKLYNNWDAEVRYCYDEIPQNFRHCDEFMPVLQFSHYAEEILKSIQSNIR